MADRLLWLQKYYGSIKGATVTKVSFHEDETGIWPVLHFNHPDRGSLRVEVSRDPEGNGPGFLFGLEAPTAAEMQGASSK